MIIKERTKPLILLILGALLRRLPNSHQKYQQILEECGRRQAGYIGEKSLDYYFRELPQNYMILHDINLPDGDYNCQIDTLLLTPEFALAIDVKNMAGKLLFDTDSEQFIQINNGIEKGYPYPIAQGERHQKYLQKLLAANHHFPPVPVEYLVVISNSYTTYAVTGKNAHKVKQRVCKSDVFLNKIALLEKQYSVPLLTAKDLRKLCRLLVKMNTVPTSYVLKKYDIQKSDLKTGVHCLTQSNHTLVRKNQKWYCPNCEKSSKSAHIHALEDYFLLFGPTITNKQFREFAHIKSRHLAKRLLQTCNLQCAGKNRYISYYPKTIPW